MAFLGPIGDAVGAAWDWTKGAANTIGELPGDYMNGGRNRYQPVNFGTPDVQWGGEYGADSFANAGLQGMGAANTSANGFMNQAYTNGPQSFENQTLADREAQARGGDQSGAIQLAREGAMGQSPSQAAWLMQSGLDQGIAGQQAMMGGARGNAGISNASGNAAAGAANLQNQAYTQAGALRANEMANYTNLYGNLANTQRQQDQSRLGLANANSQFNAGNTTQYRLGMGNLANQSRQTGLGYYSAAQNPYNSQMQGTIAANEIGSRNANEAQSIAAGINQSNTDARQRNRDALVGLGGTAVTTAGGMFSGGRGVPPPKA